jgi:hypothetical protein
MKIEGTVNIHVSYYNELRDFRENVLKNKACMHYSYYSGLGKTTWYNVDQQMSGLLETNQKLGESYKTLNDSYRDGFNKAFSKLSLWGFIKLKLFK